MKRNGKIELLRVVFAVVVILFHVGEEVCDMPILTSIGIPIARFFYHGNIAVEFFFLVSGFLMAKSIYKKVSADVEIERNKLGTETVQFVLRKLLAILPYSIGFAFLQVFVSFASEPNYGFWEILKALPSVLFLQRTGVFSTPALVGVGWYVGSMLIAMMILYPICRKNYNIFTHVIAPIGGFFLLGYVLHTYGELGGVSSWSILTFRCNLRALGEIALGTTCFEVSQWLCKKKMSIWKRALCSAIEVACYGCSLFYICSSLEDDLQGYVLILLAIAVTISFSQQTLFGHHRLFQNRFCCFLGSISLPIYLCQYIPIYTFDVFFPNAGRGVRIIVVTASCILLGTIGYLIWSAIHNAWKKRKQSPQTN